MAEIVRCEIHPAIGVARVGNSPEGHFIGPEVPGRRDPAVSHFKDRQGRIKRQVARFRIFGFDADDNVVGEVTADHAEISWRVHVANKKASWYQFGKALDLQGEPPAARRNGSNISDRSILDIDPGMKSVSGPADEVALDGGTFTSEPVSLGTLKTDEAGRLLVFGGLGRAWSPANRPIESFNNDGWFDDVSDGPVRAEVSFKKNGLSVPVKGAWVIVAPPDYAPGVRSPITLYDIALDVAYRANWTSFPVPLSFRHHIQPIFEQICDQQWVNAGMNLLHGWGSTEHFTEPALMSRLADNSAGALSFRLSVLRRFRRPDYTAEDPTLIPQMYGDGVDWPIAANLPKKWLTVTRFQYECLDQWADGAFESDYHPKHRPPSSVDAIPLQERPEATTRAALEACLGGAFHPGCEASWPMRWDLMYDEPFRIKQRDAGLVESDYGESLSREEALSEGGPLDGSGPGAVTRWMVLPWQIDTANCGAGYEPALSSYLPTLWPARVPNQVLTLRSFTKASDTGLSTAERHKHFNTREDWMRDFPSYEYLGVLPRAVAFLNQWYKVGIVRRLKLKKKSRLKIGGASKFPSVMYVEMENEYDRG